MPIDRTTLIYGPGAVTYASQQIHAVGNIEATMVEETSDAVTAGYGRIGRHLKDRHVEVKLQPSMYASLAQLFPYGTMEPGDAIFGASDVPLVITPRNGRPLTVLNTAITKLAPLKLSAKPPLLGEMMWTGLVANNTSAGTIANFYTQGAVGVAALLTGFSAANAIGRRFAAVRNSITLQADDGGYAVDWQFAYDKDQPDGEPTVGMRFKALDATVKFAPVGLLESAYLALMNDTIDIGDAMPAFDIVISGAITGDPKVTIANTVLQPGGWTYGDKPRNAPLTFESIRTIASSVLTALHTFGTV